MILAEGNSDNPMEALQTDLRYTDPRSDQQVEKKSATVSSLLARLLQGKAEEWH